MSAPLVVYGFDTSNNLKVRVALGYKGIDYEFRTIDPADRTEVLRISGQHLTPVLVHGDRAIADSAAILRYLDANFPETPKLFGRDRAEQWEIEDWELFARSDLARPMMKIVHHRVSGGTVDDAMRERCAAAFGSAVGKLAERMAKRDWLVGGRMSAADVTAAAVVWRVRGAKMFPLTSAVDGLSKWVDSVTRYDGAHRVT